MLSVCGQLWANMRSSTKLEVRNELYCHQARTEPWPQLKDTENSVNFGRVFEIGVQTDVLLITLCQMCSFHTPTGAKWRAREDTEGNRPTMVHLEMDIKMEVMVVLLT